MPHIIDDQDVADLVDHIADAGVRSVTDELAEAKAPGVFVKVTGYTLDRHIGHTLNTELILLVPDQNPRRARRALTELLNQVLTKITPSGPIVARTVVHPSLGQLPGLLIPLDVITTPEEQ